MTGIGRLLASSLVLAALVGTPVRAADFRDETGLFDLEGFFEGASVSAGRVVTLLVFREAFTASFTGRKTQTGLDLDEHFLFEDGPRLQRWSLETKGSVLSGTVSTERSDGTMSVPVRVSGRRTADGAVFDYVGTPPGGGRFDVAFRHELTANADGTVANHVTASKFGLRLAVSDVTFAKSPAALQAHLSRP